jgi:hypothetical protein
MKYAKPKKVEKTLLISNAKIEKVKREKHPIKIKEKKTELKCEH